MRKCVGMTSEERRPDSRSAQQVCGIPSNAQEHLARNLQRENIKINCAEKHFAAIGVDYRVVADTDDLVT